MENVLISIATQAPGTVAVIVLVIFFLNHMRERDAQFLKAMADRDQQFLDANKKLAEQIAQMQTALTQHAEETAAGINEMHRRTAEQRRNSRTK